MHIKSDRNIFGGHIALVLTENESTAVSAVAAAVAVAHCYCCCLLLERICASVLLALEAATEINSATMRLSFIHPMILFHFLI